MIDAQRKFRNMNFIRHSAQRKFCNPVVIPDESQCNIRSGFQNFLVPQRNCFSTSIEAQRNMRNVCQILFNPQRNVFLNETKALRYFANLTFALANALTC